MDMVPNGDSFNDDSQSGIRLTDMDHDYGWSDYWTLLRENKSLHSEMVSDSGRTSVLAFGSILIVWSLCLHGVIFWITGRKSLFPEKKHAPFHWLLASLSAGQVVLAVLVIPVELLTEHQGGWTLGSTTCKWWRPTHIGLVALYFWGHFAVTVERYLRCVKTPTFQHEIPTSRQKWLTGLGISGVWFLSFCCAAAVTFVMRSHDALLDEICAVDMTLNTAFVLSFVVYFTPTALILTASVALMFVRCQGPGKSVPQFDHQSCTGYIPDTGRRLAKANEAFGSDASIVAQGKGSYPEYNGPGAMLLPYCYDTRDLRASVAITIVSNLLAVSCWAPFYVINLLVPFCRTVCVDPTLWTLSLWFGYSSLGLSPIVWFFEPSIRAKAKSAIG